MLFKHALLRHNIFTLLHQTLIKKSFKKSNYPEIPPKTIKNPPLEVSKTEDMLKMTDAKNKKQKCQKNKRALGSGRHYSQNQE